MEQPSQTTMNGHAGGNPTWIPSSNYTRRPPSPPTFNIPIVHAGRRLGSDGGTEIALVPKYESADPTHVNPADLDIITDHRKEMPALVPQNWTYERRRLGSRILDFLHLGPNTIIRDLDYLKTEGFTMIVVVRDMGARDSQLLNKAMLSLGITGYYADVAQPQGLIGALDPAIRAINVHLLSLFHANAKLPEAERRRGKVLVTCETGNDRSANLVAAYIMAVYGRGVQTALQFINLQRFCCMYNDDSKRMLQSWDDIIKARSTAASGDRMTLRERSSKRAFDDVMDIEDGEGEDDDRFMGREDFAPFRDL